MTLEIQTKFETYNSDNPEIYKLFTKFSGQVMKSGMTKYSANAIFERIRWYVDIETAGDKFKVNNNYRPYYARKLMSENKEFAGFFEIRELK